MLTRIVYPLALREKIFYKVKKLYSNLQHHNISLAFNKRIRLDLTKSDIGHQSIILTGFYELELSKAIVKLGTKGGLLVDVGANYGYFSCLWASLNSKNSVIAFEAAPNNIEPLKNNVNKNLLAKTVKVVPVAMGKEKGKFKFDLELESKQTGWGGLSFNNDSNLIEVEVDTLDDYTTSNNISKIDVLKIDTEGADTWVLFGAKRLLKEKKIDHIFFEHNPPRMELLNIAQNEAKDFLEKFDYAVEQHSPTDFYAYPA
jgi:FkbM family methyltransferase